MRALLHQIDKRCLLLNSKTRYIYCRGHTVHSRFLWRCPAASGVGVWMSRVEELRYRYTSCCTVRKCSLSPLLPLTLTLWTGRGEHVSWWLHLLVTLIITPTDCQNKITCLSGEQEIKKKVVWLFAFFSVLEPLHKLLHLFQEDTLPFSSMGVFVPLQDGLLTQDISWD